MALLEVSHLGVGFRGADGEKHNTAVDDVSFALEAGEVLGVVGESGSGKSVTALSILGLLPYPKAYHMPGSSVRFAGRELIGAPEEELRRVRGNEIAFVFQEPMSSLNPLHTIEKQIGETLRLHGQLSEKEAKKEVLRLLKMTGIKNARARMKAYPFELSGGQRQRIMIAMAIANHPKILIADEPTTALDVTIQAQILELMKDLQKKTHMGIIFITHNLGVVADICDKVSVMYAGRIVEQGPVDDIFYEPAHPYTMGLLRSMPRVDAESYERLIPIEGSPVDMLNPPEGCPFAPRCEHCMKICLKKMPPYVEVGENHRSACWLRVQEQMNKEEK